MTHYPPRLSPETIALRMEGAIANYRAGDYGTVVFTALMTSYGMRAGEIDYLVSLHHAENEAHRK